MKINYFHKHVCALITSEPHIYFNTLLMQLTLLNLILFYIRDIGFIIVY